MSVFDDPRWQRPTMRMEICMAAVSIYWGLWVALPFDSMSPSVVTHIPQWLGEFGIGAAVLAVGLMQASLSWYAPSTSAAIVAAMTWGFITFMFFKANPLSTGMGIYPLAPLGNLALIIQFQWPTVVKIYQSFFETLRQVKPDVR